MEDEVWKRINYRSIKNKYMISNYGRVMNIDTDKILSATLFNNGYLTVSLSTFANIIIKVSVHILVMLHFGNDYPNDGKVYIVNHKDGVKTNNYYANLEWVTYKGNYDHARNNGMIKTGDDLSYAKVSNRTVELICECLEKGIGNSDIMKKLDLPNNSYYKSLIIRIKTGKQWKHISSKYNFEKKSQLRKYDYEFIDSICSSIDKGYKLSEICKLHNITKENYDKIKKLVFFIRTRQSYKNISEKYSWWK